MTNGEKQAKIAFVGCGAHATRNLYPSLAGIPEIDLVAVCDLKEDLAQHNARRFGARNWYTSVDKLLDAEQALDGVIIVGIPPMMQEVGEKVLRSRGVPIFVEKPPAINAEAAQAFAPTAAPSGTRGMVAFMKRFSAGYVLARQVVDEPGFGAVSVIDGKFSNGDYGSIWGLGSPGLSYLTGQAVHIFDLIQYFGGPVGEIYAKYIQRTDRNHGFAVTVAFAGGAIGSLNLNSFETWEGFDEWFSIAGLHNYVTVDDMLYVNAHKEQGWAPLPADPHLRNMSLAWKPAGPSVPDMREMVGYVGELREFARCILEQRRPGPDLEAGAAAMKVGQAIWDSSCTGKVVHL